MQAAAIPAKFPVTWGSGQTGTYIRTIPTTTVDPTAASLTLGWPVATFTPLASGGSPPDGRDANGITQMLTAWDQWHQAGGPVGFDSAFCTSIGGYPKGALLIASAGTHFWLSTADNNTANPDTGGAGWTNLSALGGVLTGSISSAGYAPNPVFSGTIAGGALSVTAGVGAASVSATGTIYGSLLETTPTGSINIGNGASNIGGNTTIDGTLTVDGSFYSATSVYSPLLATTAAGSLNVGTGTSSFGGIVNFPDVTITGGNIAATSGTVTAEVVTFTSELTGPYIAISDGNIDVLSGTVTAVVLGTTAAGSASIGTGGVTTSGKVSCASPGTSLGAATILNQFYGVLSGSGYKRIADQASPTGYMLLQWGNTATANNVEVVFPIAFPNAALLVVLSEANANASNWGAGNPTIHGSSGLTVGGFAHWTLTWNGSIWYNPGSPGNDVSYIAIGY